MNRAVLKGAPRRLLMSHRLASRLQYVQHAAMLQMDQEQQQGQPWGHDDDDNNMMGSFLNTNILFVLPFYLREGPQASAYPDIDMGREMSQTCVIESYACKR